MDDRLELEFLNKVIRDGFVDQIYISSDRIIPSSYRYSDFIKFRDEKYIEIYERLFEEEIVEVWMSDKTLNIVLEEKGISYKRELEINLLTK